MLENKTLYHFDKHFVNNPLPFGDISLLQIGRRYCKPTEIITAHPHLNWFELTIVTSGKGVVITNGVETQVQSGDIYLSFPCDVHEIRANEKDKLEYDFFSFSCNDRNLKISLVIIGEVKTVFFKMKKYPTLFNLRLRNFWQKINPIRSNFLPTSFI